MKGIPIQTILQPLGEVYEMNVITSLSKNLNEVLSIDKSDNDFSNNEKFPMKENDKLNLGINYKGKYMNQNDPEKVMNNDFDFNFNENESITEFNNQDEFSLEDKILLYLNKSKNYQISPQKLNSHKDSTVRNSPLQNSFPLKISNRNSRATSNQEANLFSSPNDKYYYIVNHI